MSKCCLANILDLLAKQDVCPVGYLAKYLPCLILLIKQCFASWPNSTHNFSSLSMKPLIDHFKKRILPNTSLYLTTQWGHFTQFLLCHLCTIAGINIILQMNEDGCKNCKQNPPWLLTKAFGCKDGSFNFNLVMRIKRTSNAKN